MTIYTAFKSFRSKFSFQEAEKKFHDVEFAIDETFNIEFTVISRRFNCKIARPFRQSRTAFKCIKSNYHSGYFIYHEFIYRRDTGKLRSDG